ncbi:MotA/TolQ/ExbB proton channel family protein [Pseudodonghicola flavimaris]|uniref:MotA/TolQ/ExbB proton channel family protein n=1 Tax=Pseudodonghicola flavimaris TaxID=3050036 RepID=A0ABT7F5D8_9RHOB|nr:MotA/TolQ/ExbB proton channel family protein [Pseudodonghicola flavimaris]MDK3019817.1 MotA/TolQ/ExbB proton channel family protein [Pseudodonghicola flavimaris]
MEFLSFDEVVASVTGFLDTGGPSIWAIAALSVITVALILWKAWDLLTLGAWNGGRHVKQAMEAWERGDSRAALAALDGRRTIRARLTQRAMTAHDSAEFDDEAARQETVRVAKALLARGRAGLRALELIATIAPLLGLLGTVLGMIAAFQALQEAGARADPATLAGGIWEALLTTAAGMGVAIPASMALTWFESVNDRLRRQLEDIATRVFLRRRPARLSPAEPRDALAAE